ncbi:MAG TPA: TRAP transporter TatT component family protein [Usitatibacter sp.]|nr:TRAP transporter TatT component family protein [Usitatibacter sp.]
MRNAAALLFLVLPLAAGAASDADRRAARELHKQGNEYGREAMKAGMFSAMSLASKMKDSLHRAVELDPDFLPARFTLIEFYAQAPALAGGNKEKAMEQAAEIRKRDAVEGHRAFARIHALDKKDDLAVKEMTQAVQAYPKSVRAHYYLGNAYLNQKAWKAALQAYDTALALDPGFMPAYLRIGNHAARSESNYARGEESLRKYLAYTPTESEPGHAGAWYWLGLIQEKQGRKADARESYLKAQKLLPEMNELPEALKRVS